MRSRLCFVTISLSFAPDRGAWALNAFGLIGHGKEKENISAYFRDLESKNIKKRKNKKKKKQKKNKRNYFKDVAQFSLLDLF